MKSKMFWPKMQLGRICFHFSNPNLAGPTESPQLLNSFIKIPLQYCTVSACVPIFNSSKSTIQQIMDPTM
ncbi:hypothetical protein PHAVU_003G089400 [Phaseolus vulgaris]|uniref:Uncharacterized protein n=1 Tax=Phaseolus vulgaris TaxID=3885 RepID=V7C7B5_PHAVU|nr:hypothetical protein PHAVU_003G089400g [Phaseolus vulgaris]ESW26077.1 hypothetical protein PHAVU_003G089400g [Phaseolus vulgaris]